MGFRGSDSRMILDDVFTKVLPDTPWTFLVAFSNEKQTEITIDEGTRRG